MGEIWWQQLGSSLRLIREVLRFLQEEQSFVLQTPEYMPWRDIFCEKLKAAANTLEANRNLRIVTAKESTKPEELVFRELCPRKVRNGYWPNQSVAEYLCDCGELTLDGCYVWVQGIANRTALRAWKNFIKEYDRCAKMKNKALSAVFLLEYHGEDDEKEFPKVIYRVRTQDCRVFCLEVGAELEQDFQDYLTELALHLGQGEPEKCACLLEHSKELLRSPISTAKSVLKGGCYSDGRPMIPPESVVLHSLATKAQLVQAYPQLEQFRLDFITSIENKLCELLPISNEQGEKIKEPQDLEYGTLYYLSQRPETAFSKEERSQIKQCRELRNKLAHNTLLTLDEIRLIQSLRV